MDMSWPGGSIVEALKVELPEEKGRSVVEGQLVAERPHRKPPQSRVAPSHPGLLPWSNPSKQTTLQLSLPLMAQELPPLAPPPLERLPPTPSPLATQESMLPLPPNLRRLVLCSVGDEAGLGGEEGEDRGRGGSEEGGGGEEGEGSEEEAGGEGGGRGGGTGEETERSEEGWREARHCVERVRVAAPCGSVSDLLVAVDSL